MSGEKKEASAVALDAIRVDPRRNYARSGIVDGPEHPEVRRIAESLKECGRLLEPVGVRTLSPPVPKDVLERAKSPATAEFSHELVYGYRRFVAASSIGWTTIECVSLGELSDADARQYNVVENLVRADPTDYDTAHMLAMLQREEKLTATEIAKRIGSRTPFVEQMLRIVARCPKEILEQWRLSPTPEYRRALDRISKIEAESPLETQRKQRDEWARFLAEREGGPSAPSDPFRFPRAQRAMGRREIEAFRAMVDQSNEVLDATGWRPLAESERTMLHAILRYVQDPRSNKNPLR
jgi:ParB/RepB/Spo0J family partition protein